MKVVDQDSGKDLDPEGVQVQQGRGVNRGPQSDEPPEVGSVHRAKIVSIRAFGAFVQLEDFRSNGLVHVSQVTDF